MKKYITFTFFFAGLFLISSNYLLAQIPTDGLIGKYSFNGNANNEVGDYSHGIISGPVLIEDRCGVLNSAYHFNSVENHISIRLYNRLIGNNITISLWAKADFLTSNCMAMLYPDNWQDRCVLCAQYYNDPSMVIWDFGNCTYNGRTIVSGLSFSNEWHHYVYINSETDNTKSIYMDNVCISSQNTSGSVLDFNRELYIGAGVDWQGGGIGFNGSIDDLRIYNRALTSSEVSSLFQENSCNTGFDEIESNSSKEILLFPNPVNDEIQFSGFEEGDISIFNLAGQTILFTHVNQKFSKINIANLSAGTYLIKILTNEHIEYNKLFVKN